MTMLPHFDTEHVTVYEGDCIDVMRQLPDASVDAVVTDPPYGLEFMGKDWDAPWENDPNVGKRWGSGMGEVNMADGGKRLPRPSFEKNSNVRCRTCTKWRVSSNPCKCEKPDFPNLKGENMRAFQAWCEQWAAEALRVLKPGGHLLAFGGTRTFHRLAAGIEDAGFEIRDSIAWLYGSGFPKSLDVSKAIDKMRGDGDATLTVTRWLRDRVKDAGLTRAEVMERGPFTEGQLVHWLAGTALVGPGVPGWEQWQRLQNVIGFPDGMNAEVWRLNGRKGAPGDNWADREVIGTNPNVERAARSLGGQIGFGAGSLNADVTAPATEAAARWQGWGTALKPAFEPVVVARKPLTGTVAANVLQHGTGALNIDANRIGHASEADLAASQAKNPGRTDTVTSGIYGASRPQQSVNAAGRWPANVILDGSQKFDEARYFYTPKADSFERPNVDGVAHPTVKPVDLMRWLVRLVTPKGGTVLEPFAGSGTTVEAAVLEGFRCIAIEREADYLPLIMQRVSKPHAVGLDFDFEEAAPVPPPAPAPSGNGRRGEASAARRYTEKGGTNFAPLPGRRRDERQPRPEPDPTSGFDFGDWEDAS